MVKNHFLPFAIAKKANVLEQSEYEELPALQTGFSSGKASSAQINKVLRQASTISHILAQFMGNNTQTSITDDGDLKTLADALNNALKNYISKNTLIANLGELAFKNNLTAHDVAALPITGGVLTGELTTSKLNLVNKENPAGTSVLADGNILGGVWGKNGNLKLYIDSQTEIDIKKEVNYTSLALRNDYLIMEGRAELKFDNGKAELFLPLSFDSPSYTIIPIDNGNEKGQVYSYAARPISNGIAQIWNSSKLSGLFGFQWIAVGLKEKGEL